MIETYASGEGGGTRYISWLANGNAQTCLRADPGRRTCCASGLQGVSLLQAPIQLICRTFWQVALLQLMQAVNLQPTGVINLLKCCRGTVALPEKRSQV